MKHLTVFVLGAGALAAASPAFASNGYVGAAYVRGETEVGSFEDEGDGFDLSGAVAFQSGGLGFEVDAGYSDIEDSDALGATGHIYTGNAAYRLGGFVGLADVEDDTIWSVGGEGLLYFQSITLGGAVGYANADEADADAWGVDGEVRYFATDSLRFDGSLGWTTVDAAGFEDDAFTLGVGAEYQFAAAPISVFGGYERADFDESEIESSTLRVGVRYAWGGNLRDRDRAGPAFAGLSSVANVAGGF